MKAPPGSAASAGQGILCGQKATGPSVSPVCCCFRCSFTPPSAMPSRGSSDGVCRADDPFVPAVTVSLSRAHTVQRMRVAACACARAAGAALSELCITARSRSWFQLRSQSTPLQMRHCTQHLSGMLSLEASTQAHSVSPLSRTPRLAPENTFPGALMGFQISFHTGGVASGRAAGVAVRHPRDMRDGRGGGGSAALCRATGEAAVTQGIAQRCQR